MFAKSRGAGVGTHAIVQSGDDLLEIRASGSNGTDFVNAGTLSCEVSGTVSGSIIPTRWIFNTMNAAGTLGSRVFIMPEGGVFLGTGAPIDDGLGSLVATGSIESNSPTAGIGYRAGAGGTVTQATNKSTSVTLDRVCGIITMHNASLAAGTAVTFTLNNTAIAAEDYLMVQHSHGGTTGAYAVTQVDTNAGNAVITVRNLTAGALAEAIVLRFFLLKAVTA
jgi:hypothetical protein